VLAVPRRVLPRLHNAGRVGLDGVEVTVLGQVREVVTLLVNSAINVLAVEDVGVLVVAELVLPRHVVGVALGGLRQLRVLAERLLAFLDAELVAEPEESLLGGFLVRAGRQGGRERREQQQAGKTFHDATSGATAPVHRAAASASSRMRGACPVRPVA
jgi:hypothetical protein